MRKHDFLKNVVTLCLAMMVILTISAILMSIISVVPLDSAALGVLMAGWCGELLLTLLKRRFEAEDRDRAKREEKKNDQSES